MAMGKFESLPRLLLILFLALFYGTLCFLGMLYRLIVLGPTKFFYVKKRDTRPSCMDDPSLGTHKFVDLKTGVKIHYVISGPEDRPLMVFVHGFPECWYSWRHQIREFNKDYRCVAFDMRGYGESSKPGRKSDYCLVHLVEDLKELILALGYDNCVLVCHDWGGAVAFTFTMKYPDMVTQFLVCNIPHPQILMKSIQSNFTQFRMSWYMFFFQLPWLPELAFWTQDYKSLETFFVHGTRGKDSSLFSDDDMEAFKFSLSRPGGLTCPLNYYRASMLYKRMRVEDITIKPPTLIIWGRKDRALHQSMAEMSANYIPNFTLKFIDESGHWVQQEEPAKVNKYMRDFLESQK